MSYTLLKFYSLETLQKLQKFLDEYIALVKFVAQEYEINLDEKHFSADHLGLQVVNKEEFDECDNLLKKIL